MGNPKRESTETVKPPTGDTIVYQTLVELFKTYWAIILHEILPSYGKRGVHTQMGGFTLPIYSNDPQAKNSTLTMTGDNYFAEILKHSDDNGGGG